MKKMIVCTLLRSVMVLLCPISDARADWTANEAHEFARSCVL